MAVLRKTLAERIACAQDNKYQAAMRALANGTASDFQQKLVLGWLINVACRVDETCHWPGDPATTAYLEGRRSIACDIVALMKAELKKEE